MNFIDQFYLVLIYAWINTTDNGATWLAMAP